MKIGLISDIHGNWPGLLKALTLFNDQGVETVLCAGDLIEGEPYGDKVVSTIREKAIPCVLGNHDELAFENQKWLRKFYRPEDRLSDETVAFVSAFPPTLTFTFGETRLLLTHGTPWSNSVYVFPDSASSLFDRVVAEANADIVVLGHTHTPMCRQIKDTWIINPGSVAGNRDADIQSCAVLEIAPFTLRIFDLNSGKVIRTGGTA